MKKLLCLLGTITLIGTSTTSLVACNTPQEYTLKELAKLKEENKIHTDNQEIKDNLEWIAPQEKPFNTVDNKYYYVVWRGDKNDKWKNINFNYNFNDTKKIDKDNSFILYITAIKKLQIWNETNKNWTEWSNDKNKIQYKSVYRWSLDTNEPGLILDENSNVKINRE
ncbi:lipoprotein [Spiroplasma sp. ald]|uniref:lipoprotein n=1 Tax=Spiroplasma sp. ald TaxID=2490849 RepID=UPI0037DC6F0F